MSATHLSARASPGPPWRDALAGGGAGASGSPAPTRTCPARSPRRAPARRRPSPTRRAGCGPPACWGGRPTARPARRCAQCGAALQLLSLSARPRGGARCAHGRQVRWIDERSSMRAHTMRLRRPAPAGTARGPRDRTPLSTVEQKQMCFMPAAPRTQGQILQGFHRRLCVRCFARARKCAAGMKGAAAAYCRTKWQRDAMW
jgi:hypothetical protein